MIKLENICKTYQGDTYNIQALQDITLNIEEGEFVSIMGRSGSGKTTLLNIIGFLDTATSGNFYFCNEDVSKLPDKKLWKYRRDNVGFVFQNFALMNHCDIFDNISLPLEAVNVPRRERIKRVNEILDLVGITGLKHKFPAQVSGGQRQRVAIARAFVGNPKIILADEPTGSLDAGTGDEILGLFKKINDRGTTVVIVTHDEKVAQQTNRLIVLDESKMTVDKWLNHYDA